MRTQRLKFFFIFLVSTLIYLNTINHEYVLDDFSVIKENFVVKKGFEGIPTIWKTHYRYGYGYQNAHLYRPLSLSLFAIQWELAPNNPTFPHFTNVILYALLCCLVFIFLTQLFGEKNNLLSFLASLLFSCHPIHTEVVANIKSMDDILVLLLGISSFLLLFSYLRNQKKAHLYLSLTAMLFALFSKESAITLIGVIPILLVLFKNIKWKKALVITSYYLIPTMVFVGIRIKILGSISGNKSIAGIDNLLVKAPNIAVEIATALKIMGLYVWKLIFPHPLVSDYSFNQITLTGFENPFTWLSILIYGIMLFLVIYCWRRAPIVSFSLSFFLLTISLYTNLFYTIGTSFGERLLFIPSLGFSILCAYLLLLPFKIKSSKKLKLPNFKIPIGLTIILCAIYSFKTIDRNKAWKNNLTLYSTDIKNCPNSARCHYYNGLGIMKYQALASKNKNKRNEYLNQSIQAFINAIAILPGYSDAHGELGLAYYRLKNYAEAEKAYLKSIQFNKSNAVVYSNLGSLYFELKSYQKAKASYENALQLNPNLVDALANYAAALGTLGDYNRAIQYFKKAIKLNPNEATYYKMAGITYQNLGKQTEANQYLAKAKQLQR